ncbi:MAG TPA: hypothetical protein VFI86_02305 [Burkholderiales bacterium]|nr:hypothetical protein [Burkholderiales bacterium]
MTTAADPPRDAAAQLYIMFGVSFLSAAMKLRRYWQYWASLGSFVPQLEGFKERIAYLKLLQGIAVVTFLSLLGWLVTSVERASRLTVSLAIVGVVLLGVAIIALHRNIEQLIEELRTL